MDKRLKKVEAKLQLMNDLLLFPSVCKVIEQNFMPKFLPQKSKVKNSMLSISRIFASYSLVSQFANAAKTNKKYEEAWNQFCVAFKSEAGVSYDNDKIVERFDVCR